MYLTVSCSPSNDATLSLFYTSPPRLRGASFLLTRPWLHSSISLDFCLSVTYLSSLSASATTWDFLLLTWYFVLLLPLFYFLTPWNIFLYTMNSCGSFKWRVLLLQLIIISCLNSGCFSFLFYGFPNPLGSFLSPLYELSSLHCSSFYYLAKHFFKCCPTFHSEQKCRWLRAPQTLKRSFLE